MTTHLNHEQFAALIAGSEAGSAAAHAAQCDACSAELAAMRAALRALPQAAELAALQNDGFWRAQRLAIAARIEQAPGPRAAFQWALAMAAMVLIAVFMNPHTPTNEIAAVDPDHELLIQIQQSVSRRTPDALAPAELLVAEMDSALRAQSNQ